MIGLQGWFDTYNCQTPDDINRAKRKMAQCIILAGLSRSDFFEHAAFFGGTALRILYNMPRFSEDLNFSLQVPNDNFTLTNYFKFINAPPNAVVEQKLIVRPFSFYISAYKPEYLFASKMHAVIYRKWYNRIKGIDWYDLECYVKNNFPMNLKHFSERAKQNGNLNAEVELTPTLFIEKLKEKINALDIKSAKDDIARFVYTPNDLNIWSKQYFLDLAEKMRFV